MANQNRETLKQYFQTGSTPTQAQFADLIDSALNQVDDSITADAHGQVGIGNASPAANLNVRGKLFMALTGTISVAQGATSATGTGTNFDTELAAGDAIQIGAQRFEVAGVTDATHLELAVAATAAIKDAGAFRDANLLLIENGNGETQFIIDKSGNVGIGTGSPTTRLHVNGKVTAAELAGKGSDITNLSAANLEGTLNPAQLPALTAEQIPNLPASIITTGQLKAAQLPELTAEQIPDLSASKITSGQLKLDQLPALTPDQIPDLPASKITGLPTSPDSEWIEELQNTIHIENGHVAIGPALPTTDLVIANDVPGGLGPVLTLINLGGSQGAGAAIDFDGFRTDPVSPPTARIQSIDSGEFSSHLTFQTKQPGAPENPLIERLRIDSAGNVGIGTVTPQSKLEIAAQDGLRISGYQPFITLEDTNQANKCGYLQSADGNLNFIPDSFHAQNQAAMVIENGSGTVNVPGTLRANQLEGSGAGITSIPAGNLTGQLNPQQLPPIHAAQIADKLAGDQIISLPAEKITGKLSPAQLPDGGGGATEVPATNISGVLSPAQIPTLDKITGVLTVDQIPPLPASKINSAALGVGPGGRPLLASGTIMPGSTQNVFAIPMTTDIAGALEGAYSLEIYTRYLWVAWTDLTGTSSTVYNIMTRTVLAGMVTIAGDNQLQIESMILAPTQTNHPDPKFPTVSCSIVSSNRQAWLQIQATADDVTLTVPPSQFSPVPQYYVYSLI